MSIKNLVESAVKEINDQNMENVEARVKRLVNSIVSNGAEVARLQRQIAADKAELAKLELPAPVSVEV